MDQKRLAALALELHRPERVVMHRDLELLRQATARRGRFGRRHRARELDIKLWHAEQALRRAREALEAAQHGADGESS